MKTFIIVYGTAVLLLMGIAEYRGWSLMSYGEQKGVPKSLRENPGTYRSSYARYCINKSSVSNFGMV